tara:strand:- start:1450 stop:2151 length:702 start_codon:yes stop_codon:yes gene_type:complete
MNDFSDNRYFILIKKKKISFQAFNSNNDTTLKKEILIDNYSIDNVKILVEDFLKKNIFGIEKDLKNFVKDIYIIFENDLFFEAGSSIKHNIQKKNFDFDNIKDILLETKNQFKKFSPKEEIVHMVVDKYILDGHNYKILPQEINSKNLIIQVNFVCLDNQIINDLKKIFSKYQISVNKILSYDFLKGISSHESNDIFKLADNSIKGVFENEILISSKTRKNLGFFEKFFNFFN